MDIVANYRSFEWKWLKIYIFFHFTYIPHLHYPHIQPPCNMNKSASRNGFKDESSIRIEFLRFIFQRINALLFTMLIIN